MLGTDFIVDGFSTNDTSKFCKSFCTCFIDHLKSNHESIPFSTSQNIDQKDFHDLSLFFRHVTEAENLESLKCLNIQDGINYIYSKFLVISKFMLLTT